jgi:hypothetical protein
LSEQVAFLLGIAILDLNASGLEFPAQFSVEGDLVNRLASTGFSEDWAQFVPLDRAAARNRNGLTGNRTR